MWQSVVALLAAYLCAVSASDEEQPRIFGGSIAAENEFPFQVSVVPVGYDKPNISTANRTKEVLNFCGGSIVSASWVLTAAHCIEKIAETIYVGYGSSQNTLLGLQPEDLSLLEKNIETVSQKIVHEEYFSNFIFLVNDIALLKMRNPILLDGKETAAAVLPDFDEMLPSSHGLITGWGVATPNGKIEKDLRKLDVQAYNCNYTKLAKIPKICTKGLPGSGLCNGDSGGPLIVGGKLFGVASFSAAKDLTIIHNWECDDDRLIGYYEAVVPHRKWIKKHTQV